MTTSQPMVVEGIRWSFSSTGLSLLCPEDLSRVAHLDTKRAKIIKHGQHRTVYRVELASGAVYWKHCRLNGPRAWWREIFRGPKAKLEFTKAMELENRGIATIEPLAWGCFDQAWPKGSFLITRALDGTEPLDDYLLNSVSEAFGERCELTRLLAAFIARLHAAGVRHPDLHPGNLLVRKEPNGLQFFLIDVHDLELGPPLSHRARQQNLVLLNRWFQLRATRTDRLRFWKAYAEADESGKTARQLELETTRSTAELWASRGTRCLRANRHFREERGLIASGFAGRELDEAFAKTLLEDPDRPFLSPGVVLLKDSRSATVCRLDVPAACGTRPMVYKRFCVTRWSDPLADFFRPSAALRSWLNGHAFLDRGLATPRPWLMLHRKKLGLTTTGYLLCDRVENAKHLHDAVRDYERPARRQLMEKLAREIRLMHERGVSHRDLKAANILVTASGDCQFIDLVGVRLQENVSRAVRIRDLTRLNASFVNSTHVTRSDRVRFLRTYLLWVLRGQAGWKDWWRQVAVATEAKVRRNARKNRPLA
ncbi:MAG: hypothetical protein EXS09_10010 [Gemmataceae bacterium]|nr:hypothetical protein [Gemmataceae bacterium]